MSRDQDQSASASAFNPEPLFDKFKEYFNHKFESLQIPKEEIGLKEIKNKLEAKELNRPGNSAQFEFCGQLEILLDKIKICLIKKGELQEAIDSIQEAEELVADRKNNIKIADSSKAEVIEHVQIKAHTPFVVVDSLSLFIKQSSAGPLPCFIINI